MSGGVTRAWLGHHAHAEQCGLVAGLAERLERRGLVMRRGTPRCSELNPVDRSIKRGLQLKQKPIPTASPSVQVVHADAHEPCMQVVAIKSPRRGFSTTFSTWRWQCLKPHVRRWHRINAFDWQVLVLCTTQRHRELRSGVLCKHMLFS